MKCLQNLLLGASLDITVTYARCILYQILLRLVNPPYKIILLCLKSRPSVDVREFVASSNLNCRISVMVKLTVERQRMLTSDMSL